MLSKNEVGVFSSRRRLQLPFPAIKRNEVGGRRCNVEVLSVRLLSTLVDNVGVLMYGIVYS